MSPRLTNEGTGVVVSVSDDTATRLGSEWKPEKKPASKSTSKKSD